jgi:putative alpha-1,2-mannosidase
LPAIQFSTRGGLKDYNEKGYITLADERSGSRIAEYSCDDFAISEVACGLGHQKEAALYTAVPTSGTRT